MALQNLQAELAEIIFADEPFIDIVHPSQNICIHKNNIISGLIRTLQDTYPLITKLVGNDFFNVIAQEYINQYPARSGNLHDYGAYLSDFIAEYPPLHNMIYLAEVAQFEWLCHTLYFAAHHPGLDIIHLQNISPEHYGQLHATLHPACIVRKFFYPILRIIELCNGESEDNIDIYEGGVNLLIIRRQLDISLLALNAGDYAFLHALQDNQTLTEALNAALIAEPEFQLNEKLLGWIQDKTIVELDYEGA